MPLFTKALALTAALTFIGGAHAKLDLNSKDNTVVYWGQNSIGAKTDKNQYNLASYCENDDIDVIVMAFLMQVNGPGGAPEYDFANISKHCEKFEGTGLKKCPDVAKDIAKCQKKGKTILLSIGGATYSEGGFDSEESAQAGAELVWKTFGPGGDGASDPTSASQTTTQGGAHATAGQAPTQGQGYGELKQSPNNQNSQTQSSTQGQGYSQGSTYGQGQSYGQNQGYGQSSQGYGQGQGYSQGSSQGTTQGGAQGGGQGSTGLQGSYGQGTSYYRRSDQASTKIHRPFGSVAVDGFDLDFEAANSNMNAFAQRLRELMDAEKDKKYFLTAAPQCPYPDAADKDFLNGPGPVSMDAVFVQFYNNPCGLDSFQKGSETQDTFNFNTWNKWAKNDSKNKDVKVLLGVPANKDSSQTGFVPREDLKPIIEYAKKFDHFGGMMIWDVSQAYANKGFLSSVGKALKGTPSRVMSVAVPGN